jgi:16S rRNA (cytosine967-C5)-methyltransferase
MPVDVVRDAAVDVLLRVYERGMRVDAALDKTLRRRAFPDRGRRFMTQLAYGTVRHTGLSDHVLRGLCNQPLEQLPMPVWVILRMAVFQSLFCHQVTHPAMVHTSVELVKKRSHAGLARVANAVLRKAPQSVEGLRLPDPATAPAAHLAVRHSLPVWLVERWIGEWGLEGATALCRFTDAPAPTSIRVNTRQTNVATLQSRLEKSEILTEKATPIPEELTLLAEAPLHKSKWFQQGQFLIQDPASMLPPHLLEPRAGERVLDLCAAPGGKTTHLAQLAPEAWVVAADCAPRRLQGIVENVERLGLPPVPLVCAEGQRAPWAAGSFDAVLLDAPCSGLGTLRRHPELKLRIQPEDIDRLAALQGDLLRSALALCKNGGRVVYSVCTFTPQETVDVVQSVLAEGGVGLEDGPEFLEPWKIAPGQYRTANPHPALDGFFLTRLRKLS